MKHKTLPLDVIAGTAIMELKETRQALGNATIKLATVQVENRRLRRMVDNNRGGHILHRARADAEQILAWRWTNYSVSRRACESYGMKRRRWIWATGLLRKARIIADNAPAIDDAFLVEDIDDALRMLEAAVKAVEAAGMESLLLRLPRGHAKWPKRAR
jgi:hypothetical protein